MADNKLTPTLEVFTSFSLLPRDWHASKIKLRDVTRSFHLSSLSLGLEERKRAKCVKKKCRTKSPLPLQRLKRVARLPVVLGFLF
jgi:hypothetical protein